MRPYKNYDHQRHVDEQNPPGSLVEWDLDPDDDMYWHGLKATHGETMLVLQTNNEWVPPTSPGSSFPACEVLQGGERRWVAAMYLRVITTPPTHSR